MAHPRARLPAGLKGRRQGQGRQPGPSLFLVLVGAALTVGAITGSSLLSRHQAGSASGREGREG